MSEYRRVLIPIDLSPGHPLVAPAVRRIVDTSDAEITLLHVVDSQPWVGRAAHTLRLMSELEVLANRRFRGARLTRRIEWGRPADCILNVLRADRLDAVLMTAGPGEDTSGAGPLGAVANEVIAEAPCPVLLEWPSARPVNHARVQPVCCAIEREGDPERVMREALWAAKRCEAPLILICPVGLRDSAALRDPAIREREIALTRAWAEELRDRHDPDAMVCVEAGHPVSVIGRALRFHGAGLLVSGGSREKLLAAEGECPVLYIGKARIQSAKPKTRQHELVLRRSA